MESFGISLCDAVYLKNKFGRKDAGLWKIPRFTDLHPGQAWPLHYLGFDMHSWFPVLQGEHAVKYYTKEELREVGVFNDLNPAPAIGRIPVGVDATLFETLKAKSGLFKPIFNPKFRIMFSMEKEMTRLVMMS